MLQRQVVQLAREVKTCAPTTESVLKRRVHSLHSGATLMNYQISREPPGKMVQRQTVPALPFLHPMMSGSC